MPENTVSVCRPGPWGNPFVVGKHGTAAQCVKLYKYLLAGKLCISMDHECVEAQERAVKYAAEHIEELRGKNLACWCRQGKPCHADVLLRVANSSINEQRERKQVMKLSKTQEQALNRMGNKWKSAYELRISLSTLEALRLRGLIEVRGSDKPGAFSMPRTHLEWRKAPTGSE